MSFQFNASGNLTEPLTWSREGAGVLPMGITLTPQGLLSGTVTGLPGGYTFSIRVTDANGCLAEITPTWTILCPDIAITPAGQVTTMMHQAATPVQFTAAGGNPTVTWSHTGTLPSGMTLSSGGQLSGTPVSAP
ncbi:MAG: putative Ig domain-containing protein, partial [Gemmatimonas sp.]